jgi:hypothetical protein
MARYDAKARADPQKYGKLRPSLRRQESLPLAAQPNVCEIIQNIITEASRDWTAFAEQLFYVGQFRRLRSLSGNPA